MRPSQCATARSPSKSRTSHPPSRQAMSFRWTSFRMVLLVWTSESPSVSAICCWVIGTCRNVLPLSPTCFARLTMKASRYAARSRALRASDAQEVFIEHLLFPGGDPGDVVGEPRVIAIELVKVIALEHAKQHRSQRFDRMLHFAHQAGLQTHEVTGHDEVENLPAPVGKQLVAEPPACQHRVEMRAVVPLDKDGGTPLDRQFTFLEGTDELQLLLLEAAEHFQRPERTFFARVLARGNRSCRNGQEFLSRWCSAHLCSFEGPHVFFK